MLMKLCAFLFLAVVVCTASADNSASIALTPWLTLPATPTLPDYDSTGYLTHNGAKIWYAIFGSEHVDNGHTVIFIHGGLGSSDYFAHQIEALRHHRRVVSLDSRGHGRSTFDSQGISYDLMAADVIALMDELNIGQADLVGCRLHSHFCFAANSNPSGVLDVSTSDVFMGYINRQQEAYPSLNPNPDQWDNFLTAISAMWATQPDITADELAAMTQYIWIVDADHEEAISRTDTLFLADSNEDFGLVLLPRVSHFAFIQDPDYFTQQVLMFFDAYTLSPASSLSTIASLIGLAAAAVLVF